MTSFFGDLLKTISDRGRELVRRSQSGEETGNAIDLAEALLSQKGEASGIAIAEDLFAAYFKMNHEEQGEFFGALAADFGPDLDAVKSAVSEFEQQPTAATATQLHEIAEPRRQELIRRLNRTQDGTANLVRMRAQLLDHLSEHPGLAPVNHDFDHLLASWFNRGFLVLQPISWATPAVILEKIIRYEAVHEISSWSGLRRRIDPPDRRCYAFFHPALVDEPLIFVEVALTNGMADAIAPILATERTPVPEEDIDTAVFYSISNCQRGLKGVSFGNFLIKQVAQELVRELPHLKTFVTLSPVPGFRRWLKTVQNGEDAHTGLSETEQAALAQLEKPDWHKDPDVANEVETSLLPLAGHYFLNAKNKAGKPHDPVARFHLGNGARLERLNWLGDTSPKGIGQAAGLMVNYLYDLNQIESNHEAYATQDLVIAAPSVEQAAKRKASAAALVST